MKEVYVVYWSGTGNTQAMAEAVGAGVEAAGGTARVLDVSDADAADLKDATAFALGCPSMGAEELDPDMDSFVSEVEAFAGGKTIGLFGSYDWGDGEWMRLWAERMQGAGANVAGGEGIIANLTPDDTAIAACKQLGEMLAR